MGQKAFGKFSFLYDGMDRRTELDYPGGAKTNYRYDPSYRLAAMVSKDPQGNVLDAWSYTYDAVGNRLSKTDMNGASETHQDDAGDRLTRAAYTDGTWEGFTYDPAGNRMTRTGTGTQQTYAYDAANEMISDGVSAYTYDANGNRTSMTTPNFAPNTYAYDFNNRLVTTGGPQGYEASQYDSEGRRAVVAGVGTGYGYGISTSTPMGVISDLQGNPILDWTTQSGGSIYAYRVYGPGVDEALAETHQGDNYRSYLLLHDGQGSVTAALYMGNNQVMYRNSYRAFGATTRYAMQSSVNPSRITYTGREMAPAQLLFYRARYMDTSSGNFLSQDTYRGDATVPPSLHRYVYALNNPVRYVDPSGNYAGVFLALLGIGLAVSVIEILAMGPGSQTITALQSIILTLGGPAYWGGETAVEAAEILGAFGTLLLSLLGLAFDLVLILYKLITVVNSPRSTPDDQNTMVALMAVFTIFAVLIGFSVFFAIADPSAVGAALLLTGLFVYTLILADVMLIDPIYERAK